MSAEERQWLPLQHGLGWRRGWQEEQGKEPARRREELGGVSQGLEGQG